MTGRGLIACTGGAMLLGAIAWASPAPDRLTDRPLYEAAAERGIIPDCSDIHCFRVLVPWSLGFFPGESAVKSKAYAVLANTAAAVGVFLFSVRVGLTSHAAVMAAALSLLGFGSLYTLHDSFTADPLMFAVAPLVALLAVDLKQRVLLDETLVVWGGEFGRTIYCQGALSRDNYGRDHHPRCFTMWMAGGGIRGGIAYGQTDDFSYTSSATPSTSATSTPPSSIAWASTIRASVFPSRAWTSGSPVSRAPRSCNRSCPDLAPPQDPEPLRS